MSRRKKNNIIIGSLCAVVLLMVVGYAAFSTTLQIKGTSNIGSNWSIKITNITSKVLHGNASNAKDPEGINTLTAKFEADLVSPGDSIEYEITVTNGGTIDAVLDKITMSESDNQYVEFTATINGETVRAGENINFTEDTKALNAGQSKTIIVTVTFKDIEINKMEPQESKLTITLDYSQKESSGGGAGEIPGYTGTVYSYNVLTDTDNWTGDDWAVNSIFEGDDIEKIKGYTEDYKTLGSNFFLKHELTNGKIDSSEVCFMKNSQMHCFKPNEFETSKEKLFSIFSSDFCESDDTSAMCNDGSIQVILGASGSSYVRVAPIMCGVFGNKSSACYTADKL